MLIFATNPIYIRMLLLIFISLFIIIQGFKSVVESPYLGYVNDEMDPKEKNKTIIILYRIQKSKKKIIIINSYEEI